MVKAQADNLGKYGDDKHLEILYKHFDILATMWFHY